ncbi:MAG TPA: Gfo/Idh/MocA family oxidoreductase [Vicinamibacteria bacterium]|nr:Gfo/Idh/MocA family oxidoreductase [Vicinamibacteria bacterium]
MLALLLASTVMAATPAPNAAAPRPPLRIAVAGLTHGHVHGLLGRRSADLEIVGIAEKDQALARRYAARYGIPEGRLFPDLATLLDRVHPEAVAAFGPTSEHLAVVEACAPRRVPVMVEKPLATTAADARRIAELARAHRIPVVTNYETTWYGSNRRLYQLVRGEEAIGAIRKMVVHDGHPGPVAIGVQPEFLDWLLDPVRNGGGALMDFGCYGADLMSWLMKGQRPLTVTAVTQQLQPTLYPRVEDEATLVLTYPGAQGIIEASWNWPFGRKDTHVYGEHGYVLAVDGTRLRVRTGAAEREIEAEPPPPPRQDPFAFLAAVARGELQVAPDEPSGLELNVLVMEILDAGRESARTGRTVPLPPAR